MLIMNNDDIELRPSISVNLKSLHNILKLFCNSQQMDFSRGQTLNNSFWPQLVM